MVACTSCQHTPFKISVELQLPHARVSRTLPNSQEGVEVDVVNLKLVLPYGKLKRQHCHQSSPYHQILVVLCVTLKGTNFSVGTLGFLNCCHSRPESPTEMLGDRISFEVWRPLVRPSAGSTSNFYPKEFLTKVELMIQSTPHYCLAKRLAEWMATR